MGKASRRQSVREPGRRVRNRAAEHPGVASRRKRKDQSRPVRLHPQQLRSGREEEPQLRLERRGQVHQNDGRENERHVGRPPREENPGVGARRAGQPHQQGCVARLPKPSGLVQAQAGKSSRPERPLAAANAQPGPQVWPEGSAAGPRRLRVHVRTQPQRHFARGRKAAGAGREGEVAHQASQPLQL